MLKCPRHRDAGGHRRVVPVNSGPKIAERPLLDFQAGYVQRSVHEFHRAGTRKPWQLGMSYVNDAVLLRHGRIDDGTLRFG